MVQIYQFIAVYSLETQNQVKWLMKAYNSSILPLKTQWKSSKKHLGRLWISDEKSSRESRNVSWGLNSHWPELDFASSSMEWSVILGLSWSAGGIINDFKWHPNKTLILKHAERQLFPLTTMNVRIIARKKCQAGPILSLPPDTWL